MTDRPIIFSAPMVRALLDGRKTQTRRILKPQPYPFVTGERSYWNASGCVGGRISISDDELLRLHRWVIGDRLWVRESFVRYHDLDDNQTPCSEIMTCFRADGWPCAGWYDADREETRDAPPWKPSIHMPRWASRLTLMVTDVRVERLNSLSRMDAMAEGIAPIGFRAGFEAPGQEGGTRYDTAIEAFAALWNDINGADAWGANPWVAAISFTVHRANIDALSGVAALPAPSASPSASRPSWPSGSSASSSKRPTPPSALCTLSPSGPCSGCATGWIARDER